MRKETKQKKKKRNEMECTKAYLCHSKKNILHQRRNTANEMRINENKDEITRN